jgi:predicted nucleotide-binding protein
LNESELIRSLVDAVNKLQHRDEVGLDALRRRARMIIKKIYGESSQYLSELNEIGFHPMYAPSDEDTKDKMWTSGQKKMLNLFNTMLEEFTISGDVTASKKDSVEFSNRIFIVHGHDDLTKEQLARILTEMELEPVILHEKPNQGRTIIEKFEEECRDIGFAFVIMTPDDVGMDRELHEKLERGESRNGLCYRARQNVVLELGFFYAKLGRNRVCCLCKGNVERPSDIDGILYLDFKDKIEEKYRDIVKELRAAGYKPRV